jgi:hypothetical protein
MISAAEIAAHIEGATVDDHSLLEELRDAALAFLARSTARYFGPVAETTEWAGIAGRSLWLAEAPTGTVTITRNGDVLEAGAYEVRGREIVRTDGTWWGHWGEHRMEYERGYTEETLPPDIRQAVIDLIAIRWQEKGREGLQSETIGGYSYTKAGGGGGAGGWTVSDMVARTIANWRRVRI